LWHEDGVGFAAVDPHLKPWLDDLRFVRFHGLECAPPAETQITQHSALEAIVVYRSPENGRSRSGGGRSRSIDVNCSDAAFPPR
jgi:hypothetical protein